MSSTSKLGRNPLEKLQERDVHESFALPLVESKPQTALEKIKEMQIQVDWPEFYEGTVAYGLKRLSRFLKS